MAYTAVKNKSGTYDVSFGGQKISTTAASGLPNFGLSEGQLTGSTDPNAPQATAIGNQAGNAVDKTIFNPPTNIPDYSGGTSAPTTTAPTTTSPTDTSSFTNPTPTPKDTTATPGSASTPLSDGSSGTPSGSGPGVAGAVGVMPSITDLLNGMEQTPQTGQQGGPAQNQQLSQKYQSYFNSVGSTKAPDTYPRQDIQNGVQTTEQSNPQQAFFDQYSSMNPIVKSLYDTAQQIMSPQNTQQSFMEEFQKMSAPELQTQMSLMNVQNVMNGTVDDIRAEITTAGGFATESQVQALASTRNAVLIKQSTALSNLLSVQQQYVGQVMQFSQADKAEVDKQIDQKTGILSTMATLQTTMNQNSLTNYQKTLTTLGGDYSAFASTVPQGMQPYVENLMGLAPGTLSDPQELHILTNASYKQMQLQIQAQRVGIAAYNAGYPLPGAAPAAAAASVSPFSSTNPVNNTQSQTQYTVQQGDGLRTVASKFGITTDAGLQAIAQLNGLKDINSIKTGQTLQIPIPVKDNATGQTGYISPDSFDPSKYTPLGSTPVIATKTAIDKQYDSFVGRVKTAQATPVTGSPLNKGRLTRNANSALKNYIASPVYTAVSSGATYLARINAAMADPGSISDTSLADSIIKIETGGGQVTEAQLNTYFAGQSFADRFAVLGDKVSAKGGVLSPQQRADLAGLAKGVFDNYQQQYENLYVQAMGNLVGQGIPLNYGGNFPDFLSLIQTAPATQ